MAFVALSYCWGRTAPPFRTVSENVEERLGEFSLSELPKTILDAVEVTRMLEMEYLWIDNLCMLQDQQEQNQLDELAGYYEQAACVILAASSSHYDMGFLQTHKPSHTQYELPFILVDGEKTEEGRIRLIEKLANEKLEPTETRVWTDQEEKNARRLIRFGSYCVEWRCREVQFADSDIHELADGDEVSTASIFDGSMSSGKPAPGRVVETELGEWREQVKKYSRRNASCLDDKLVAISASAQAFCNWMDWDPSNYKAGLWLEDLPSQLLWCRDEGRVCSIEDLASETSTPSWSWASNQYGVRWVDCTDLYWQPKYFTLEVQYDITLLNPTEPFKRVKKGRLTVKGYAPEAFWDGQFLIDVVLEEKPEEVTNVTRSSGSRSRIM